MDVNSTAESRFASRIVRVRKMRGLTQRQLADASGVSYNALTNMEQGRKGEIRVNDAVAISAALGVALADMLSAEPLTIHTSTAID